MRRTLSDQVEFRGVGLHGGALSTMLVSPAPGDTGIMFIRSDVAGSDARIPARYDLVSDTQLCTKLTNEAGVGLSTVEHVMAAFAGCGISDAVVRVSGPEVPIMDGSAAPFVEAFRRVGTRAISENSPCIRITAPVEVTSKGRVARVLPAETPEMSFEIDFAEAAIGRQAETVAMHGDVFSQELADCRTFCLFAEVEQLRSIGLAKGGGLENAIVVDGDRVLNPEGLRRTNEFVRHKMLDAIGDLALAGAPIIGRYEGIRAGHEMTNLLLHALFAQPECWEWAVVDDTLLPRLGESARAHAPEPAFSAVAV